MAALGEPDGARKMASRGARSSGGTTAASTVAAAGAPPGQSEIGSDGCAGVLGVFGRFGRLGGFDITARECTSSPAMSSQPALRKRIAACVPDAGRERALLTSHLTTIVPTAA